MAGVVTTEFLEAKRIAVTARAQRLARLTPRRVGLRPQDIPYAPSAEHFQAVNQRLAQISARIAGRLAHLQRIWSRRETEPKLIATAMVEREIDRARRSFGMFFEIFSQRGSSFARPLAAHDMIATDCYRAVRAAAPDVFSGALLKPVTYMEHGYSPATQRRGVQLARLLGDKNPFPVIRIPWDRDNPWQAVFLHEVAHNIQADLGLWHENQTAVASRMMGSLRDPLLVSIFRRWHKEIFADLAAILLGGPAAAAGMMNFLSHPSPRSLTYRPGGAHPTGYVRGLSWRTCWIASASARMPTMRAASGAIFTTRAAATGCRRRCCACSAVQFPRSSMRSRFSRGRRSVNARSRMSSRFAARTRSPFAAARCSSQPGVCRPSCRRASS